MGSASRVAGALSALGAAGLLLLSIVLPRTAGASVVTDVSDGFSVALPTHWREIPLPPTGLGAVLSVVKTAVPALGGLTDELQRAADAKVRLVAVGPFTRQLVPSFGVGVEQQGAIPRAGELFTAMASALNRSLRHVGAQHLHLFTVHLRIGPALEAKYAVTLGARAVAAGTAYFVPHGPRVFVLSFTAATAKENASVVRYVANRWHWR